MATRMPKSMIPGILAAVSLFAGGLAVGTATAAPGADGDPPYAVETFDYPNAAKILKERGIDLRKGDGHILLTDCGSPNDFQLVGKQGNQGPYCFKVTGSGRSGFLSLGLTDTFAVVTGDHALQAGVVVDGRTTSTVDIAKNSHKVIDAGTTAAVLELRVAG
ncbi:hypothetical protein AB0K09_13290 [Streptomyces sp. NPDC049577]|uniref:hypothetical protein n=1 Tax=Streptomyces sp. NPDC049577 TaxID=3155153 RepID=UPI0034247B31